MIHRLTNVPTSEFESGPGHIEAAAEPFFACDVIFKWHFNSTLLTCYSTFVNDFEFSRQAIPLSQTPLQQDPTPSFAFSSDTQNKYRYYCGYEPQGEEEWKASNLARHKRIQHSIYKKRYKCRYQVVRVRLRGVIVCGVIRGIRDTTRWVSSLRKRKATIG